MRYVHTLVVDRLCDTLHLLITYVIPFNLFSNKLILLFSLKKWEKVIQFNNNFGGKSARQTVIRQTREAQFQLLHLSVLREYIEVDIARDLPNQSLDKERVCTLSDFSSFFLFVVLK